MQRNPAVHAPAAVRPEETRPEAARLPAAAIVGWSLLWYLAFSWAAVARLDLIHRPRAVPTAIGLLAVLWALGLFRPLVAALLVLAVVPLFGNHPGGWLMELVNLPLAASAAGLALQARRLGRPVPSGAVWIAAGVYVGAAVIAMVPAVPGMMAHAAQINHWPTALMEALTTAEDAPLYSLSSLAGLTLCAAWAFALAWRAPDDRFFASALRVVTYAFLLVVAVGILNHHDVIRVGPGYLLRIDPRTVDLSGFQSIFWNPGWFAWYFVMVFGLAIGLLWMAPPRERRVLAGLLAIAYGYFFTNPQRGGFVALHVSLALTGGILFVSHNELRVRRVVPIAASILALAVVAAYTFGYIPQTTGSSLFRLFAAPEEAVTSNSVRMRLWTVALQMWRDAPVFGIGEGSFAWRFSEYAAAGSALDTPLYGDAHNTWLQILATRGLLGMLAFLALVVATARAILRRGRVVRPAGRGLAIGLGVSLTAFLVYSVVQAMFYLQAIQILFWFVVAATAPAVARDARMPRAWKAAVAAAAVVALVAQAVTARPLFAAAVRTTEREPRGFYAAESDGRDSWRWSLRAGSLCLQPRAGEVNLRMTTGDPRADAYPRTITVRVDGAVAERFDVFDPGMVTKTVRLPRAPGATAAAAAPANPFGECTGHPGEVRLGVEVDRTWSPLATNLGTDARTLGVALFAPTYPQAAGPEAAAAIP